jgi:hypothetical protein
LLVDSISTRGHIRHDRNKKHDHVIVTDAWRQAIKLIQHLLDRNMDDKSGKSDYFLFARRTPNHDAAPPEGRALRVLVFPNSVQVCAERRPIRWHCCAVLRGLAK